jgi:predicted metallo-beta-lactamase superfamily hydrolase
VHGLQVLDGIDTFIMRREGMIAVLLQGQAAIVDKRDLGNLAYLARKFTRILLEHHIIRSNRFHKASCPFQKYKK